MIQDYTIDKINESDKTKVFIQAELNGKVSEIYVDTNNWLEIKEKVSNWVKKDVELTNIVKNHGSIRVMMHKIYDSTMMEVSLKE